ncbi:MAG: methyltransferase, partial [Salinimicrobium sp.]
MNKPFQFKHFTINQDKTAMKVGTDGVLLGAWVSLADEPYSILDIGAGTGVIALMIAQRSSAELIDALEIDEDAYEQAVENFENSEWGDRLFCYHAAFDEFVEEMQEEEKYDLIVSNPPFYSADYSSGNPKRDQARFADALPFGELLEGVSLLLSKKGKFSLIIPK